MKEINMECEMMKSHLSWLEERIKLLDDLEEAKLTIDKAIKFIKEGEM